MSKYKFFVAGTDTDVGKTFVSVGLLAAAQAKKMSCYGLKPVAAGCESNGEGLRNEDALKLMQSSSVKLSYQQVNPIVLEQPIAPHVAAKIEGKKLSAARIVGFCRGTMLHKAEFVILEGAGGWRVPLNNRETMAEIPKQLSLPVILVVGLKLGCINHALLSVEAILKDGLEIAGWVANQIDPDMQASEQSIETLTLAINAPLIGIVPFIQGSSAASVAQHLQIDKIL
jgi:dethiobiotin synthetase